METHGRLGLDLPAGWRKGVTILVGALILLVLNVAFVAESGGMLAMRALSLAAVAFALWLGAWLLMPLRRRAP
jgi:hypothetical protein